jgi:hypothetical protein
MWVCLRALRAGGELPRPCAQMGLHLRADGSVDTSAFKIVYVAPMKALVAEMVGNFSERLKEYNMQARGGPCSRALAERVCCALAVGWGGRAVHGLQSLIVC